MLCRPTSGALRRGLAVLALATLVVGCGTGGQETVAADTSTSGPVVQGPTLPAGWPPALTFPDDASVTYATTDDTGMSVLFDAPQDLAALRAFFGARAQAMGYQPKTDDSFADMLATSWTDGKVTISVTATPVDDRSSGIVMVQPNE